MTTPTLVNTFTATGSGSATLNVTSVQNGDWIVACLGNAYDDTTAMNNAPTGSGSGTWVAIGTRLGSPDAPNYRNYNLHTWRKVATGTGTYGVTMTVPNEDCLVVLHLRNCSTVDFVSEVTESQSPTPDKNQSVPGGTPASTDALLIGVWGNVQFAGANSYTPPAGMTERADIHDSSNNNTLSVATQVLASGAATGTKTAVTALTPDFGTASKLFAITGVPAIRFGSPTAPLGLAASPTGKKVGVGTQTAPVALSATRTGFKKAVATRSAPLTLAASAHSGRFFDSTETAPLTLAATSIGRKVIATSATALTLGATCVGFKIGVSEEEATAITLDADATDLMKTGIDHPEAELILAATAGSPVKTGGQPVPVTRPPLPPLEQPLRLIAQQILTKKWLDWDLPVNNVEITKSLSGADLIRGHFKPEMKAIRELGMDAWSTYIHAEIDGVIRATGILMPVQWDEEEMAFEAVGVTAYPEGTPYLGPDFSGVFLDPLGIVRQLWTHVQSYPEGNLGVVVDNTTSLKVVGEPAKIEKDLTEEGDEQEEETNTVDDIPGSKNNPVEVRQASVSTAVWNALLAMDYQPYQITKDGIMAVFPSEYDFNKAKGVPVKAGESTTTTVKMKFTEEKPYTLFWWDLVDVGKEIADLAKATPFDFYEDPIWNADKTDVVQRVRLAYPRKGTKRLDLRFMMGENILDVVQVAEGESTYASEVIVIGSGEGRDAIRGYTGQRFDKRLRRVAFSNQKNVTSTEAANALAQVELLSRRGRMLEFTEITVDAQHPNAILGEYQSGDDIYVQVDLPWVGELGIWHRITAYTYRPDRDLVTISLARSDSFRYGSTL